MEMLVKALLKLLPRCQTRLTPQRGHHWDVKGSLMRLEMAPQLILYKQLMTVSNVHSYEKRRLDTPTIIMQ